MKKLLDEVFLTQVRTQVTDEDAEVGLLVQAVHWALRVANAGCATRDEVVMDARRVFRHGRMRAVGRVERRRKVERTHATVASRPRLLRVAMLMRWQVRRWVWSSVGRVLMQRVLLVEMLLLLLMLLMRLLMIVGVLMLLLVRKMVLMRVLLLLKLLVCVGCMMRIVKVARRGDVAPWRRRGCRMRT